MRLVSSLRNTSTYDAQLDATLVDELAPFCFAAGAWRPQVLISRALWERLDDQQRTVVLAHERGHVQRRDPFLKLLVHAVSSLHVPAAGRWLVNEAAIAAEQLCDERAALIVGDRLAVASTILSLERLAQDTPALDLGPLVVAFDECAVERRVRALMAPAPQATSLQRYGLGVALFIIGLLVASESIHHVTEAALSHLTH
jgi:beta-lactamase regulating signal transducer with metallopeptidase domain